jgi:hypothetical protein
MQGSYSEWAVSALAMLLTGVSKGGFGGMLGGIAVPLMAQVMPPAKAAAVTLPILCLMDLSSVRAYWRRWSSEELKVLLAGALFGVLLGSFAFGLLPEWTIKLGVGGIALAFALHRLWKRNRAEAPRRLGWVAGVHAGLWAGLTSTLVHAGGPPVLIYLFGRGLSKERFVATVAMFFTVVNAAKLIPYASLHLFSDEVMWLCLVLAPLAPLGVWLGVRLQNRLPERPFFFISILLLCCSGLQLIYDALA